MDRRQFLTTGLTGLTHLAGLAGVAALPLRAGPPADALPEPGLIELSSRPTNYESTRGVFVERLTPTKHFYLRSHFDAPVVDPSTWRLAISGLVAEPLSLSLRELEQMPQTTIEAVLQCAGNGRALFRPRMPGVQWQQGAMGNAQWRGVRLRDVLLRARPYPEAKHAHLRGADGPMMPMTPSFLRAVPMAKALHEDTLIALSMNGRPLPQLHGGPARLVMPGWVADGWTKWIKDIVVDVDEPRGFFYETAYRFPRTPVTAGTAVPAANMAPMSSLNVKSIIASPAGDRLLRPGKHDVVGVAFSGGNGVARVEVRVDDGPWRLAQLDGPGTPYGFRLFHSVFQPTKPGRYLLRSRAVDERGEVQPEQPAWNPSGYLYNAIDPVSVEVGA